MDSILYTIKKMLGFESDYTAFDSDIIILINSVIASLVQVGLADINYDFQIVDGTETWSDYMGSDARLNFVKEYIYLKVRNVFDPPASSTVAQALDNRAKELEWRISVTVDPGDKETKNDGDD